VVERARLVEVPSAFQAVQRALYFPLGVSWVLGSGAPGDEYPVRRLGTPADMAVAALFLAAEESSWITGVILGVAGGLVMVQVSGE
jgi:NAD(P)-dependent dehydrogenase (short-subunit alcohol dehydrogenase family)